MPLPRVRAKSGCGSYPLRKQLTGHTNPSQVQARMRTGPHSPPASSAGYEALRQA